MTVAVFSRRDWCSVAGGKPIKRPVARALAWEKSHQDRGSGSWPAASMNKRYPAGSMAERFLRDAATAFEALTPIEAGQ